GEITNGVVDIKQKGKGKRPRVMQLSPRQSGLAQGDNRSSQQQGGDDYCRRETGGMARDEFSRAVAQVRLVRRHRQVFQMPADIVGKLLDGGIAPLRLFLEGLQQDQVEFAAQPPGGRRVLCRRAGAAISCSQTARSTSSSERLRNRCG